VRSSVISPGEFQLEYSFHFKLCNYLSLIVAGFRSVFIFDVVNNGRAASVFNVPVDRVAFSSTAAAVVGRVLLSRSVRTSDRGGLLVKRADNRPDLVLMLVVVHL